MFTASPGRSAQRRPRVAPRRILGALAVGGTALAATYLLALRPRMITWGATDDEVRMPLPGDDLVPGAWYQTTRAVTIQVPPEAVWPWLVQMGQGRGGFYTYEWLEQAAGTAIRTVDDIIPELQNLAIGDVVLLSPAGGPKVARLEPRRALVLHDTMDVRTGRSIPPGTPKQFAADWTWTYLLQPMGDGATRLLVRTRADFRPRAPLAAAVALLLAPAHFIMERGMLLGIKRRAERALEQRAAATEHRPSSYAVRDGLAIFRFGAGDPLLFMPYPHSLGMVGDPRLMALLERLVGFGQEVLTFDPPASGQSTRPPRLGMPEMLACAEETLAVCGVAGPVDVLGHNQGGVAALAFALERPERVRRLVLANTPSGGPAFRRAPGALWNRSHPDFWRFARLAILHLVVPVRATETLMTNLVFRDSYVERARFTPAPIRARDWLRPARPRAGWGQKVAWRLDYRRRLAEVRAPTLVTAGRCDPQMPPACAEELARGLPNARLVVFERSGHYPFIEEPDAFWAAVGAFLATGDTGVSVAPPAGAR